MDAAAISHLKTVQHQFCVFTPKTGFSCPIASVPVKNYNGVKRGVVSLRCGETISRVKCAKEEVMSKILLLKMEEEEELIGMKKLNEKCNEIGGGIVELMECLEREAIMGQDEGREPTDYNRRALIFHNSSKVFQALKQHLESTSPSTTTV